MVDEFGMHGGLRMTRTHADGDPGASARTLPARTVLVAAGTQPNTVLAREDAHNFHLDGKYFQACDEYGEPVKPETPPPSRGRCAS